MVNSTGANGINNGTCPPDDILKDALRKYALRGLSLDLHLLYLEKEFGYKIKHETLCKLNHQFDIPSVWKPPAYSLSKALICDKISKDYALLAILTCFNSYSQLNAGILYKRSNRRKPQKVQHFVTQRELGKLALHMGGAGIPIYGMRDHIGKIQILHTVPNDRNEHIIGHVYLDFVEENGYIIPLQMTVDGGNETGIMYGFQHSLRMAYLPDLDETQYPTFVSLQSTNNIPIESTWSYWQKAKGTTIRQVIASGYEQGFFIVGNELHLLPSGVSPQAVFDFPERYNLQNVRCPVEPAAVQALRDSIVVSQAEAFWWVSDEFDALAYQVYTQIGQPELECNNGWAIFNKMVHILDTYK
ncbi:hypothetical protein GYMLUDRAFT_63468 [Collybiopsis luxurians FD-317 M1]|uniref:Uncharacterized protein n=1 Tax=Collybiopsis luxurians FD-317 M1 TaxID=944289 RepID=A0A0D0BW68_9AGAR|nr:hypothetical protein GYMLUDRAFT_63468 [Collybiopsis luxurians FD-317 M1]